MKKIEVNNKIRIGFTLLGLLFISLCTLKAQIQTAVKVQTIVTPYYSPFLNDYYEAGSTKLKATITLKDIQEPQLDVKLKITIEGDNGVLLRTKNNFTTLDPITITPNVPVSVSGATLAEYFDFDNLDISGIERSALIQNGLLPEGYYTFCIEVVENLSNKILSTSSCAYLPIRLGGIPQVLKPNNNYIIPTEPQNIMFQWTLSSPALTPATTEYQLKVYEITSDAIPPATAIQRGNAIQIFESAFSTSNFFVYDASAPTLELGKKYAYTIQVRDRDKESLFRNNGMSEPNWFNNGYPTGGNVLLTKPDNRFRFKKEDQQHFKWKIPDNKIAPSQPVSYQFKIVQLNSPTQDSTEAFKNNPVYFEETSAPSASQNGYEVIVKEPFEREKWYAWRIEAFTGEQMVASSEIRKFQGPPLLDNFFAGDHLVTVLNLDRSDLNNLKGKGRVVISSDGSKTIDIDFDSLLIKKKGEIFVLLKGQLFSNTTAIEKVEIPAKMQGLGNVYFSPNAIRLDKDLLMLQGKMQIPLTVPIDGEGGKINTNKIWVNFNNFRVTGGHRITATFNLMEPMNFQVVLDSASNISIGNTGYEIYYTGKVGLPETTKDKDGKRIYVPFFNLQEITYIESKVEDFDVGFASYPPVKNMDFLVVPKKYIVDLSEAKSPEGFAKDWKGVYVPNYDLSFGNKFDKKGQVEIEEVFTKAIVQQGISAEDKNWFTPTGLQFAHKEVFGGDVKGTFNKFISQLGTFDLEIENGAVKTGLFKGKITVPVISESRQFAYKANVGDDGMQEGFLDENLSSITFSFSKNSEDARMDFTIKRAVFAGELLDMSVDLYKPAIKVKAPNIPSFYAFGDNQIGFGRRNGSVAFEQHLSGPYKDVFTMYIDTIGTAFLNGKYACFVSAYVAISDDISSGKGGPIRANSYATIELNPNLIIPNDYSNPPIFKLPPSIMEAKPEELVAFDSVYVKLNCVMAEMTGYLKIVKGDPQWGNCLTGKIDGFIYAPSKIKVGSKMIVGKKDGMNYWFFNAYAVDKGIGYPLIPGVVNIVGIEGKVFRNMRPTLGGNGKDISIVIDPKVKYGGALYMQLIDASANGQTVKADIGLEMIFEQSDYSIAMKGEATILNLTGRNVTGGTPVGDVVTKVVQQGAAIAIDEVNKQSFTIDNWTFRPNIATDLSRGALKGTNGKDEIEFGAKITSPTLVNFSYKNSDFKLGISGNKSSKAMGIDFSKFTSPTLDLGIAYMPGDSASLNFNYDKTFSIGGAYNMKTQNAGFNLGFDNFKIAVNTIFADKSAAINFQPNNDLSIYTYANKKKMEGRFDIKTSGHKFGAGFKRTGYADFYVDDAFSMKFDKDAKDAQATLKVDGYDIAVQGNPKSGAVSLKTRDFAFDASVNTEQKKGRLGLFLSETQKYDFNINTTEATGLINIVQDGNKFLLGTGKQKGDALMELELPSGNYIKTSANLINTTGMFDISYDGSKVKSFLATDSAGISSNMKGYVFNISAHKSGKGKVFYSKDGDALTIIGDKLGYGRFALKTGDNLIDVGANKNTGSGSIALQIGSDNISLNVDREKGLASISSLYKTNTLQASYNEVGKGFLKLKTTDNTIALSGDKAGAGSIFFQRQGILVDVAASKMDLRGKLRFILNKDSITGMFDAPAGKAALAGSYAGNVIDSHIDKVGTGDLYFKIENRTMKGLLNMNGLNSIFYQEPDILLYAAVDKTAGNGAFRLKLQNDSINANIDKNSGNANIAAAFAGNSFGALIENKIKGSLRFKNSDISMAISADKIGVGLIDYTDAKNIFHIYGDKIKGDADVRIKFASDSLSALVNNGEKFSGSLNTSTRALAFNIAPNEDDFFNYNDADISLNGYKKEMGDAGLNYIKGNQRITLSSEQAGKSFVGINNDNDSIRVIVNDVGKSSLVASLDKNTIESSFSTTDKNIKFITGDYILETVSNDKVKYIDFNKGTVRIRVGNDKRAVLNTGKNEFVLTGESGSAKLFQNGKEITWNPNLNIDLGDIKIIPHFDIDMNWLEVQMPNFPNLNLGFDAKWQSFFKFSVNGVELGMFELPDGFNFKFGDKFIAFDMGNFKIGLIPNFEFSFSAIDFKMDMPDLKFNLKGKLDFDLAYKGIKFEFNPQLMKLGFLDKFISLDPSLLVKLQWMDQKFLSYKSGRIGFTFDDINFEFEKQKLFAFNYKLQSFKLFDKGIELGWEDKLFSYHVGEFVNFKYGQTNFFKVSPLDLALNWDGVNLNLGVDSLNFNYKMAGINLRPDFAKIKFDTKSLELSSLGKLKFNYDALKFVDISLDAFTTKWDDLGISFGKNIPLNLAYLDKKFSLGELGLNLSIPEISLGYKFTKELNFKLNTDSFLISLDKVMGSFGKYKMSFGKLDGLFMTNGLQSFTIKDKINLDFEDINLSLDIPSLEMGFTKKDLFSFIGSPEMLGLIVGKYKFNLGKIEGLAFTDGLNAFKFGDDLTINIKGDYKLGILGLKTDLKKYFINKGNIDLSFSKIDGFGIGIDTKSFSIGGLDKYFAVKYDDLKMYCSTDIFTFEHPQIGFTYGGDRYFGIKYQTSDVIFKKDMAISMLDKGKGVEINSDGIITLINGQQRIVAGGNTPIKFTDPNGMNSGDEQDGFSFDIAGMNFGVKATEGNNVAIVSKSSIADIEITSQGEGLMQAAVNRGNTRYGTLYKNQYTWGLALGNSSGDMAGPAPTEAVSMSGPSNIGKITTNSTSVVQLAIAASYSSRTKTFTFSGQATGTQPLLCMSNVKLDAKFSPDTWFVKVADESPRSKWALIQPLCLGTRTTGFLYVGPSNIKAGINMGYHQDVNTGWFDVVPEVLEAKLGAYLDVDIGGSASIQLKPDFELSEMKIYVDAEAGIYACGDTPLKNLGCKTIIGASIEGTLTMKITKKEKSIAGEVEGCVEVFGEDFCGDMDCKLTL